MNEIGLSFHAALHILLGPRPARYADTHGSMPLLLRIAVPLGVSHSHFVGANAKSSRSAAFSAAKTEGMTSERQRIPSGVHRGFLAPTTITAMPAATYPASKPIPYPPPVSLLQMK